MVLDTELNTLFVFGGRLISPARVEGQITQDVRLTKAVEFSGLYAYQVDCAQWRQLRADAPEPRDLAREVRGRTGHFMVCHPGRQAIYIFGGQRQKEYLVDFFKYDVKTDTIEMLNDGAIGPMPPVGYTQRATIDCEVDEIHVLCGMCKDKDKRDQDNIRNSFWVYNIAGNKWRCVYKSDSTGQGAGSEGGVEGGPSPATASQLLKLCSPAHASGASRPTAPTGEAGDGVGGGEPCPRYAHQLVYDPTRHVHYLFGGNPGKEHMPKLRLDDFWELRLLRPTQEQLMRRCRYLIRRRQYREMAARNPARALHFLQRDLFQVVDHQDPEETQEFQLLTSELFIDRNTSQSNTESMEYNLWTPVAEGPGSEFANRTELYNQLVEFFPPSMTQPKANLIDLINL